MLLPVEQKSQRKIIVRAPNWIGDHIMAISFYEKLRAIYSKEHLCLLAKKTIGELDLGLFDSHIALDEKDSISKIKHQKFDLAISLPFSFSSGYLFFLSRIPNRVGFCDLLSFPLYHHALFWKGVQSKKHKSQLYLELLEFFKFSNIPKSFEKKISKKKFELSCASYIVIAPKATHAVREWPYFNILISKITDNFPYLSIIVVGGQGEKFETSVHPRVINLIGKTTLQELIFICENSKLVIANDTGVAHLSATLSQAKTLVLMGPGTEEYIRPIGDVRVMKSVFPCAPCDSSFCHSYYGYQCCLKNVSVQNVVEEIQKIIL